MHIFQCTEKLDLQCSEGESKTNASITIIQTLEQGFLSTVINLKKFTLSVKKGGFFPETDIFFFKKQPSETNSTFSQYLQNI